MIVIQTVTTYAELSKYSKAFAEGHFEVFILLGNPGLSKSTLLRKEMETRECKCLCQTDAVKFVGWHTAAKQLDDAGVPRDFHTESKVCIIANVWKELNKNIAAVEDRGLLVDFRPDSL